MTTIRKMTFTCYEPEGHASVMGIDLQTGQVTNFSKAPGSYNEVEGIFPDGLYTAVEADRQCEELGGREARETSISGSLKLDGTGKDFTRLTHFNDYEGGKASNRLFQLMAASWLSRARVQLTQPEWDMESWCIGSTANLDRRMPLLSFDFVAMHLRASKS